MVTNVNEAYRGDHFTTCTNIELYVVHLKLIWRYMSITPQFKKYKTKCVGIFVSFRGEIK